MSRLTLADLQGAFDVVYDVAGGGADDPFPLEVLAQIARLLGAHTAGYCETPMPDGHGGYELVSRPLPTPSWLHEALEQWGRQDPTHAVYQLNSSEAVAISDVLSWREFTRREIYTEVCRDLGTADSLRIYLPSTPKEARFFFFDRERRGFGARERVLLQMLHPHLALWRSRWGESCRPGPAARLTAREREILEHVAVGRTNAEIARDLWLSPHTVRKHLENTYRKLGVANRTEAAGVASRVRAGRVPGRNPPGVPL